MKWNRVICIVVLCVLALAGCGREPVSANLPESSGTAATTAVTTNAAFGALGDVDSTTIQQPSTQPPLGDASCTTDMTFLTPYMDANLFISNDLVMMPGDAVEVLTAGDNIRPNAVAISGFAFSQDWSHSALRPEGDVLITLLPNGGQSMIGQPALPRGNTPVEVAVYLAGPEQLSKVRPGSFSLLKYDSCEVARPIHPTVASAG